MGKHLIIGLCGPDKVFTLPVLPVDKVTRDGKGVIGIVFASGIESRKIEHHPRVTHTDNLCIACDGTIAVVCEDGVALIAFPVLHLLREGDADTFPLGVCIVLTACIIEHNKGVFLFALDALLSVMHPIDSTLILCHVFPPLGILVIIAH